MQPNCRVDGGMFTTTVTGQNQRQKDGSDGSRQLCLAVEETKQLHKQIEQQLKLQPVMEKLAADGSKKDGSDGSGQLCLVAEETKQLHKKIEQQLTL
ncbi:hypothetical protein QVD17_28565 [Tagetes erecta]|uniref:Uncharacterized protein n=1 Tax=Tagetes erecta TaxID=13708 RepID=A0AAD8KB51_TARER|nr:hypothetical protein QVD17_28565 [Tagetes erecta]